MLAESHFINNTDVNSSVRGLSRIRVTWLRVQLAVFRADRIWSTELDSKALNDEALGEDEVRIRAQLKQSLLGKVLPADALHKALLLGVIQLHLVESVLVDLQVSVLLFDVEYVLDFVNIVFHDVLLSLSKHSLLLGSLFLCFFLFKGILATLLLLFVEQGPQVGLDKLLSLRWLLRTC